MKKKIKAIKKHKKALKPKKEIKPKEVKKLQPEATDALKNKKFYQPVRGMHDVLPKDELYWDAFYKTTERNAKHFQFGYIEVPILEEASLFNRSIGRGTDVVEKEMYVFEDRDGGKVALRPEATAGVARAYLSNGLWNAPQPVKVWTWGQMFRHDRLQAGRYRQFFQISFETIGVKDPAVDAELILTGYNIYNDLGLPVEVHLNTLGTKEDRARYMAELTNYYRSKRSYLCEDCRNRLSKNPLRLLDCKEEQCQPIKEAAPQIVDWLEESSRSYFMKVIEYLDELNIPYQLDHTLVRGLDYYSHTVFGFYISGEAAGSQSALGGGGRYDYLIEELGGQNAPGAGFACGVERAVLALKEHGQKHELNFKPEKPQIYFAQLGEEGRRRAIKIINDLRCSEIKMAFNLFKGSLKAQLEIANNLKVPFVLILGQKEVQDKTIIIRDMESGVQEIVDQKKIEAALKKKLAKE